MLPYLIIYKLSGMKRTFIIQGLSCLLIILWIYAAGSKLWDFNLFASQLSRQPLPQWSGPIVQWLLPLIELTAAFLFFFSRAIRIGFLLSIILMSAFTLYVGFGLAHVYDQVPCSCGGILGKTSWGAHLIFNIVFTSLSFWGWCLTGGSIKRMKNKRAV